MSSSRKFRKIALKSEVLSLELEEIEERDAAYLAEFNQDFAKEIAFLAQQNKPEATCPAAEVEVEKPQVSNEFLKKLHRELARVTHPDLNPDADTLEFKKMQSAYEEADGAYLIWLALERDLVVDLPEEDLDKIEEQLDQKKDSLGDIKESIRWAWGRSDKSEEFRAQVRFSLSIDESAFQEWLKTLDT
jgi:hypothetical protein